MIFPVSPLSCYILCLGFLIPFSLFPAAMAEHHQGKFNNSNNNILLTM